MSTKGQYSNVSDFALMFYNARWYDPALGRFTSADTIVPNLSNPLSYDRYAYSFNNPTGYTDPAGHDPVPDFVTGLFFELVRNAAWFSPKHQEALTVRPGESEAMLAGRIVGDVVSIGIGGEATVTGTGAAITVGVPACATGVGCVLGGGEVIAGGVALAGEGMGMGLRGVEGLARIMAMTNDGDNASQLNFGSEDMLREHFEEHGAELGYRTEQGYLAGARKLFEGGG